jgi:hypothetical protein
VSLADDLARIAEVARGFAGPGEKLTGVIPAEPSAGLKVYVCAFAREGAGKTWLALDDEGSPLADRALVRDAVSIAAMCELAEDVAGGGWLEELRTELAAVRRTEAPPGLDEAEEAVEALERTVGRQPRVATPAYLDEVGAAVRRLEEALGELGRSPFVETMKHAVDTVDELSKEIETNYKLALA